MNIVVLQGRLTRDPDFKVKDSTMWTRFSLAVNRVNNDEADFINCVAFGKTSQIIADYVRKGQQILVEGRLQMNRYEKNGEKRTSYDVIVSRFHFCGSKEKDGASASDVQEYFNDDEAKKGDNFPF